MVGQPRGTQRYAALLRSDEDALTRDIVTLASQYGRYGYRRITALLQDDGWRVGKDRVQRIWRREGLKVPKKQPPVADSGWQTVRVCVCVRGIRITCGVMTSCRHERMTGERCDCSR